MEVLKTKPGIVCGIVYDLNTKYWLRCHKDEKILNHLKTRQYRSGSNWNMFLLKGKVGLWFLLSIRAIARISSPLFIFFRTQLHLFYCQYAVKFINLTYSFINRVWSSVNTKRIQMKCIDLISEADCGVVRAVFAGCCSIGAEWLHLTVTDQSFDVWCWISIQLDTSLHPQPHMLDQLRAKTITVWFCFKERPHCCRSALLASSGNA